MASDFWSDFNENNHSMAKYAWSVLFPEVSKFVFCNKDVMFNINVMVLLLYKHHI